MPSTRRRFLAALGTAATAAVAGCGSRGRPSGRHADVTDWPSVGHDASNTGFAPERTALDSPSVRWTNDDVTGTSPPVVADGKVLMASAGKLAAFDTRDGSVAWRFGGDSRDSFWASPTVRDGTVYVGGGERCYALSADDGAERWRQTLPYGVETPTVGRHGRYVFFGTHGGTVHALDAATGEAHWRQSVLGPVRGPLALDAGAPTLYATTTDAVYALSTRDGTPRWHEDLPGRATTYPVYAEQTVYVGCSDGSVYALDAKAGGHPRWSVEVGSFVNHAPAVRATTTHTTSGTLFATAENHLVAVDTSDGSRRWSISLGARATGPPTVGASTAYAASADGVLHAVKLGGGVGVGSHRVGARRWKHRVGGELLYPCPVARDAVWVLSGESDATLTVLGE